MNVWRYWPIIFISGCVSIPPKPVPPTPIPPAPVVTRYSALLRLPDNEIPSFDDDIDTGSLRASAAGSLSYYQNLSASQLFTVGNDTYTAKDFADSLVFLISLLDHAQTPDDWRPALHDAFAWYQSVGIDAQRTVTFSSYYEPLLSARLHKDAMYRFPLYGRPPDLIDVNLALFDPAYQGVHVSGHRQGKNLVPYPTRADIDSAKVLDGQGLEIAWAKDPAEILDLQIEGSGWLDLGGGDVRRIRYDGDNGRRYRSVGQNLIATGRIPAKSFNRQRYLRYLAEHPRERQSLLNVDERYIFFRIDMSSAAPYAYGNIDVPLTPGRSIATDPKLFPRGALAWVKVDHSIHRFMLNQDEGGAIQGPGRVDLFAGHGAQAAQFASHLWNKGVLYFLVKKKR